MQGPQVLIIVAIVVVIAAAAYAAHVQHARRVHELGALAIRLGWQFDLTSDYEHDDRYSFFSLFDHGDDRRAYNTMSGTIEIDGQRWPARAGDYEYNTTSGSGSDRKTQTHRLSYIIIQTPHLGASDLFVRREGLFDRFAGFLGFDDIDFESAEFSERFLVKSSNKRFAYAVLDPRMMEFMLDSTPPTIEFRRGMCCLHDGERRLSAEEFLSVIAWSTEFFARWPKQVPTILDA